MKLRDIVESLDFDYFKLARAKWDSILSDTQKKFNIHFDTENDDSIDIKDIKIDQDFWDTTVCKFRCELRKAGGDWQTPVCYFRCQVVSGYANIHDLHDNYKMFCFIPNKNEGNLPLVKSDGKLVPAEYDGPKSDQAKVDENKCWKSLKSYLQKLVDEEIDKVKNERE